ncbi:MAG: hypothetical protein MUF68_08950 [Cyclobacteriaceae bacterium]|jgi:hypothetical protein|nr:hypothetical protein [Cyclobacteriaceae bacterium]
MDSDKIKALLERYWNCETTLEEEQWLRDFFNGNDIPQNLQHEAQLFRYLKQQQTVNLHDLSFEHSLKQKIQPKESKLRSLFATGLKLAAGISVVVASFWLVRQELREDQPNEVVDTYDDPQKAFEETKRALQLISKNFGKAQKASTNINLINEATEKLQKENKKADS